jgi:hypothetical protein
MSSQPSKSISKQQSNPFSTGGGGVNFETRVQASFVTLMLTGGFSPCLPLSSITEIKLQGKHNGFDTDDLIVFTENSDGSRKHKLLGQVKRAISITENNKIFCEVIQSAWNDFNNPSVFTKNSDVITLITATLSATDIENVRPLLEWARHTPTAKEFLEKVNLTKFSSKTKKEKLQAFRINLDKAKGSNVSDDELFEFLKHFHILGYDLDIKGITLSLLHSLIGQYNKDDADGLWAKIVLEAQSYNQNAGTIIRKNLPKELLDAFKSPVYETIPDDLKKPLVAENVPEKQHEKIDWNKNPNASALAMVNLLGGWDEKNQADIAVINSILKENYNTWIEKIREFLYLQNSPIALKNGLWEVSNRKELWRMLGERLCDADLEKFEQGAITVLSENDPQFELDKNKRHLASVYYKNLKYSHSLRKGMAESLALLGNEASVLTHCTQYSYSTQSISITVTYNVIDTLFSKAEWVQWGSLNDLLPTLAEANPDIFLKCIENALKSESCPFDSLFLQESDGISGRTYMTGLLWALERLAWEESSFIRVCTILAKLATHDSGGRYSNRPANSLAEILLPWLPHTTASIEKRKSVFISLKKVSSQVTWKLLLRLLPHQLTSSMGTDKPEWRDIVIPDGIEKGVSQKDYWEIVTSYVEFAISMANDDIEKLTQLVDFLDNLTPPTFDTLLASLSSDNVLHTDEEERLPLWESLTAFVAKHRRFSYVDWALPEGLLLRIETVAMKLKPKDPSKSNRRLFSPKVWDIFDYNPEQEQKVNDKRKKFIANFLKDKGIKSIIEFAESVEFPVEVGISLGIIADNQSDSMILPSFLKSENMKLVSFAHGYVRSKYNTNGMEWVNSLDISSWDTSERALFLSCLPLTKEVLKCIDTWLGTEEIKYWQLVNIAYCQIDNIEKVIDKLIEYKRPLVAIRLISYLKYPHDNERVIKALLAGLSSKELPEQMDSYHICQLIKKLQEDSSVDSDDLFKIEWAYLPLLEEDNDVRPKTLENRLAISPEFFCEVIRRIFRSTEEQESKKEPTEQERKIAENAYDLLRKWRTPPKSSDFSQWLAKVKEICTESGHLDIALEFVGKVLFYCQADENGLWIDEVIAQTLNADDADIMRNGFRVAVFNSRGVHEANSEAEMELANGYKKKAEDVENAGYYNLATTMRDIAKSHEADAELYKNGFMGY